jgi:hypothetical protein
LQSVPFPAFLSQTFFSQTEQPLPPRPSFQPPSTLSLHVLQQQPAAAANELGTEDVEPQTVSHQQSAARQPASLEGRIVRSPETIIEERNKKCLNWDFGNIPMQCYPTEKALFDAISKNAGNRKTDGGAHGVPLGGNSMKKDLKTMGPRRLLQCDCAGEYRGKVNTNQRQSTTKKCDCQWGFWIEQSTRGWMFAQPSNNAIKYIKDEGVDGVFHSGHNHLLYHLSMRASNVCSPTNPSGDLQRDLLRQRESRICWPTLNPCVKWQALQRPAIARESVVW